VITIDQLTAGTAKYLDREIICKMEGWQKWVYSACMTAYIGKAHKIFDMLRNNSAIMALDIIDDVGNIDIDMVYNLFSNAAKEPATIKLPFGGTIILTSDDVDSLYRCIKGARHEED